MQYNPKYFAENDRLRQIEFVRQHHFGSLISVVESQPMITHLPFLVDVDTDNSVTLRGHIARANPHWEFVSKQNALAVFQGPHCYISPTWFETEGLVPTWNYTAVHISGTIETFDDIDTLHQIVLDLSEVNEMENPDPWIPDYPESLLSQIVGFKMKVDTINGKFKLSQNRAKKDREKLITSLEKPFGRTPSDDEKSVLQLIKESQ